MGCCFGRQQQVPEAELGQPAPAAGRGAARGAPALDPDEPAQGILQRWLAQQPTLAAQVQPPAFVPPPVPRHFQYLPTPFRNEVPGDATLVWRFYG